jgi:hypothetical protein
MLEIEGKIISLEVLEKRFCCDLASCMGTCCVQGDYGAPLEEGEADEIEKYYPVFKKYMMRQGIAAVKKQGFAVPDIENIPTTPLIGGRECAYVYYEENIAKCAIEKAYFTKRIPFRKPVSCHLYPIRIKKYKDFEAVNYHHWHVCSAATILGENQDVRLVDFVKDALIRKYGQEWYDMLLYAADHLNDDSPFQG